MDFLSVHVMVVICPVGLYGALHPPDGPCLPEGEGAVGHARVLGHAERQPAAEHGGWLTDGTQ